jgi:hypothetical protein
MMVAAMNDFDIALGRNAGEQNSQHFRRFWWLVPVRYRLRL